MSTNDQVPAVDTAIELIVGELKAMRAKGCGADQLQGYVKNKLFNTKFVFQKDRNVVLKKVNHGIGTNWSMSQVKKADATPFAGKDDKPTAAIPVDELRGSSTVAIAGPGTAAEQTRMAALLGDITPHATLNTDGNSLNDQAAVQPKASGLNTDEPIKPVKQPRDVTDDVLRFAAIAKEALKLSDDEIYIMSEGIQGLGQIRHQIRDLSNEHIIEIVTGTERTNFEIISRRDLTQELKDQEHLPAAAALELTAVESDVLAGKVHTAEKGVLVEVIPDSLLEMVTGNSPVAEVFILADPSSAFADDGLIKPTHHVPLDMDLIPDPAAPHGEAAWFHHQQHNTNTTTSDEASNMQTPNTATNTNTAADAATAPETKGFTMPTITDFVGIMTARGAASPELRAQAFHVFLEQHESGKWHPSFEAYAGTVPQEATIDDRLFGYLSREENKIFTMAFMTWVMSVYTPALASANLSSAKSRFSLTGERDEGIRSSWIATGAAVIGGGMEMAARGGVTAGSAIGTLVGGIGAFFAGEMVDENVDSDFGRYVLAGTIGLALGAVGSSVGRSLVPGNQLVSLGSGGETTLIEIHPEAASSLGLLAGM